MIDIFERRNQIKSQKVTLVYAKICVDLQKHYRFKENRQNVDGNL